MASLGHIELISWPLMLPPSPGHQLLLYWWHILIIHREGFQLVAPSLVLLNDRNANIFLCFLNQNEFSMIWDNSLAPGRSECDSKNVIFNLVLLIGIFRSSHYNALQWMPQDLTDDKSTLVQVMAWCRQATSHYLSQCWPRSLSPYGVTRPQWVKVSHIMSQWWHITP